MDAIAAAVSGLGVAGVWIDTTASNIANDLTHGRGHYYHAELPITAANGLTGGASTTGIAMRTDPPNVRVGPSDPTADSHGLVTYSNVDLAADIPNLMMAADDFEANLTVITRAETAYQSIIGLGCSSTSRAGSGI